MSGFLCLPALHIQRLCCSVCSDNSYMISVIFFPIGRTSFLETLFRNRCKILGSTPLECEFRNIRIRTTCVPKPDICRMRRIDMTVRSVRSTRMLASLRIGRIHSIEYGEDFSDSF